MKIAFSPSPLSGEGVTGVGSCNEATQVLPTRTDKEKEERKKRKKKKTKNKKKKQDKKKKKKKMKAEEMNEKKK